MSDEFEAVKAVATHPATGGGIVALFGWLASRVYRGIGHRILNVEHAQQLATAATWKEFERRDREYEKISTMFHEHEKEDNARSERNETASRDRHDEIMSVIGDLRTDIAGLKRDAP